jgi:hypothetical protein
MPDLDRWKKFSDTELGVIVASCLDAGGVIRSVDPEACEAAVTLAAEARAELDARKQKGGPHAA